jgi:hypothetical protein
VVLDQETGRRPGSLTLISKGLVQTIGIEVYGTNWWRLTFVVREFLTRSRVEYDYYNTCVLAVAGHRASTVVGRTSAGDIGMYKPNTAGGR